MSFVYILWFLVLCFYGISVCKCGCLFICVSHGLYWLFCLCACFVLFLFVFILFLIYLDACLFSNERQTKRVDFDGQGGAEYVAGVGWEETFIRIYHVEKNPFSTKKVHVFSHYQQFSPNSRQFNLRTCVYSQCVQLRICSINLSHTYSVAFLNQDFKISSHLFTCLQLFKRGLHWVSDSSFLHFQGNPLKESQFQLAVDVKQASFFNSSIFPAIYAHISICIALPVLAGLLLPANNRTEYISLHRDGFLRHLSFNLPGYPCLPASHVKMHFQLIPKHKH